MLQKPNCVLYFFFKLRIMLGIFKNIFPLMFCLLLNDVKKKYYLERFGFYNRSSLSKKSIILFSNAGGELAGADLFIKYLKKEFPNNQVIVAVENFDAMKIAKNSVRTADKYCFFPYDTSHPTKKFIKHMNPVLVLFFGNIFRSELINQCYNKNIKMGVVNGFFRENLLLKKGASLCLSIMRSNKSFDKLSFLLMQTKEDVKEISKYVDNKSKISVAGFVKSDLSYGLVTGKEKEKILSEYYMTDKDTVLIAGATNFDEEIILNAYRRIKEQVKQAKLIIVPRWSYRIKEVENLIKSKGLKFKRKSELSEPSEIILVDTDINLSKLYSIGTINILGRSFIPFEKAAQGGSNIFEAAIHGKPILFGTNMSSWKEHTTKILEKFPELQVIDEGDLAKKILLLLNDKRKYLQISRGIKTFADIELQKNQNLITGCVKKIKNMLL